MSSGQKRMNFNTRERIISSDLNRLQRFRGQIVADVLHALLDPLGGDVSNGNGDTLLVGATGPIGTPLQASILDGLMVTAQEGGTQLGVTPGVVVLVDIDGLTGSPVTDPANPEDSAAKVVVDRVGVAIGSGTLALTPNASGSIRVDVVECRRDPDVVLDSDNRDIFDPSTGLFTPQTVPKVIADGLKYRIRTGTPGAGPPALEQGWLPLAVMSVPDGATDLDDVTIYDVRPLARDRVHFPTAASDQLPEVRSDLQTDARTAPGERRLFGEWMGMALSGYRAGGVLRWEYGGASQDWIDLQSGAFLESGFAPAANQPIYLWLAFPLNLPRWVRYTRTNVAPFGGRVPQGVRGIPVISTKPPANANGFTSVGALSMPLGSGIVPATTTNAVLILAFATDNSNNRAPVTVRDRRVHFVNDATLPSNGQPFISVAPVATTGLEDHYELVFNQHIPKTARRVLVRAATRFTGVAGNEMRYTPSALALDPLAMSFDALVNEPYAPTVFGTVPASGDALPNFTMWVDLPTLVPTLAAYAAVDRHRLRVSWTQNVTKDGTQSSLQILGWEA